MNDPKSDISEHRAYVNQRMEEELDVPLELEIDPKTGEFKRYWNGDLKVTLKQEEDLPKNEDPTQPDKKKNA